MARPKAKIDEELVFELAQIQCTYEEIGAVCKVCGDTIRNRFSEIVNKGREVGKTSLRRAQFKKALDGNAVMQIWLGKQYLGQSEKQEVVHEGKDETFVVNVINGDKSKEEPERVISR